MFIEKKSNLRILMFYVYSETLRSNIKFCTQQIMYENT